MKVLYIGGTGIISSACVGESLARGHDVWTLNRGRATLPREVPAERAILADASDAQQVRRALTGLDFDVVVQWTAYVPEQVALDVELYADAGQYIFISSASAYEKPPSRWPITEATPLENPFWQYSRDKIACERVAMAAHESSGFPVTIVRPSLTYGVSQIPVSMGSWERPFTIIDRMRRGKKIIVPGDGTNAWTITHNTDFARGLTGLFAQRAAIGEAFHITSDEALTWNRIYALVGEAAGVEPEILHVPTDAIVAADPRLAGTLWGDKANTAIFDNSKLRSLVPDFAATVPFAEGIAETVRWFDADPSRQTVDAGVNALCDGIAAVYVDALARVAHR
ncbi:MAG: SDR family oxidoreductase [Acidobacteria bacterium]|nr:SDR family oxidoreductase [Acidobacteriota bacterium]